MMRVTYGSLLLVTIAILAGGCSQQPTAGLLNPDSSSATAGSPVAPEMVIETFYRSLTESNADAAFACTTGDSLSRAFVDSQVRLNLAFALMGKVALERFPEDGVKLQVPPPSLSVLNKIGEVPVTVSGETATWPINPAAPMQLVLVNGQWRMDLEHSFPSAEMLRQSSATFDTIAGYITDVANEVAAGKHATVASVQQEIKRRGKVIGR